MAISLAQAKAAGGFNSSGGSTAALTTAASGSSFIIGVGYENNSAADPFTSVVDSKSNTYVPIDITRKNGVSSAWTRVYLCENGTGGASHTATLAFAPGAARGYSLVFAEVTGGQTSGILDAFIGATVNAGDPIATGVLTASQNNVLIVCYCSDTGSANPSTHTFDNSLVVPANGEAADGSSYHVGAIAALASTTGFSAAIGCSVAGSTPPAGIIAFTLKEAGAATGGKFKALLGVGV